MKKKRLLSCIVSMLLITSAAYASTLDSVQYSVSSKTLQINGTADTNPDSALQAVTLRVFKPGKTAENIKDLSDAEKKAAVVFIKQVERQADGKFSFTYAPEVIEYGNHKVYVTDPNGKVLSQYVLFLDSAKSAEILRDLNAASTKELMKTALQKYSYLIQGIVAIDEIKANFPQVELTDSIAGMIAGKQFTDADVAVKEAVKAAVVTAINSTGNATDVITLLDRYKEEIGFSDDKIYTELYLSIKEKVSEKFLSKGYSTTNAFITDFCNTVILDKMNQVSNYTSVMPILDARRGYLTGFQFAGYDALKNDTLRVYVQKAIVSVLEKSKFATIKDLQNTFNTAVYDAENGKVVEPEPSGSGGSGSSGGGSSNNSGSVIGVSKVTQPVDNTEAEVFDDLSSFEWAKNSIVALYEKGIVSGMGEKKFEPSGLVTREQFAKMLVSACGLYDQGAVCSFDDVKNGDWYYSYVASAANAGIVFGTSEVNFGVGDNITREDMAVMAFRAAQKTGKIQNISDDLTFGDDADISTYAKDGVYNLKKHGVMNGKGGNMFEPKAFATRAEAARMIYSLLALDENV